MNRFVSVAAAVMIAALTLTGCDKGPAAASNPGGGGATDEVAAERAKLSPADRALVEAQEWCVVSSDERLGAMGPPIKLDIQGQPVFVCCKGCQKKAESNPEKTLAKVAELKARAKAEKEAKK